MYEDWDFGMPSACEGGVLICLGGHAIAVAGMRQQKYASRASSGRSLVFVSSLPLWVYAVAGWLVVVGF